MKVPYIIGADLSKKTIDFASHHSGQHLKVSNDQTGFKQLIKWLKEQSAELSAVKMVMEHTGLYSYRLEHFLQQQQISYAKVPALAIKRSMGMVRGKSDNWMRSELPAMELRKLISCLYRSCLIRKCSAFKSCMHCGPSLLLIGLHCLQQ